MINKPMMEYTEIKLLGKQTGLRYRLHPGMFAEYYYERPDEVQVKIYTIENDLENKGPICITYNRKDGQWVFPGKKKGLIYHAFEPKKFDKLIEKALKEIQKGNQTLNKV